MVVARMIMRGQCHHYRHAFLLPRIASGLRTCILRGMNKPHGRSPHDNAGQCHHYHHAYLLPRIASGLRGGELFFQLALPCRVSVNLSNRSLVYLRKDSYRREQELSFTLDRTSLAEEIKKRLCKLMKKILDGSDKKKSSLH
jgi:hypothetical protein